MSLSGKDRALGLPPPSIYPIFTLSGQKKEREDEGKEKAGPIVSDALKMRLGGL